MSRGIEWKSGNRPGDYYSGRMFERDFIGGVNVDQPEYQAARRAVVDSSGYAPYERAARLAKQFPPYDPTNPTRPFAQDIRLELIDLLGLSSKQYDRVKFYTAVNTPLDHKHGVDAFIEVEDPKTKTVRRVTFDLSLNRRKEAKADILVRDLPAPDDPDPGEANRYLEEIASYAKEVARILEHAPPKSLM